MTERAAEAGAGVSLKDQLTQSHAALEDPELSARYFAKFHAISGHLPRISAELERDGWFDRHAARVLAGYLAGLAKTFRALGLKHSMSGRYLAAPRLTIDRHESGFPVAQMLMEMALDAQQSANHLAATPSVSALKEQMVQRILADLTPPIALQFALSQRLYHEALQEGGLFWARHDPEALWLGEHEGRRRYLLHWAVWDSQTNLPLVYLLEVEDGGKRALPKDLYRWPPVQQMLLAQSLAGLKLVTIARGFDADFDDLYPKRLRRLTLGPIYSSGYTLQSGPISQVLQDARAAKGEDWALVWTMEDLQSEREERVKDGWFSSRMQQIWRLDPVRGGESGTSRTERMIVLPERPYQVLVEQDPPGFRGIRKFVVSATGRLIPGAR